MKKQTQAVWLMGPICHLLSLRQIRQHSQRLQQMAKIVTGLKTSC